MYVGIADSCNSAEPFAGAQRGEHGSRFQRRTEPSPVPKPGATHLPDSKTPTRRHCVAAPMQCPHGHAYGAGTHGSTCLREFYFKKFNFVLIFPPKQI
jgi:hypothetical protein